MSFINMPENYALLYSHKQLIKILRSLMLSDAEIKFIMDKQHPIVLPSTLDIETKYDKPEEQRRGYKSKMKGAHWMRNQILEQIETKP
jgi:hypothetical protein